MPRFKLLIEYDGTAFCGWQRQGDLPTVQGVLEQAIQEFCGAGTALYAAGRTDAGVHALGQVGHFDCPRDTTPDRVRDGLNFYLRPHAVAVRQAEMVDPEFHARFSATGRRYLYRILNRRARPALEVNRVWWVPVHMNVAAMAEAAHYLLGRHDFTSFRASECQAQSPVKTLDRLDVVREGDEIHIHAAARSFLHHQVRNMVGSLKMVGEGKWAPVRLRQALEARQRSAAGPTSPACGLYLTEVRYDELSAEDDSLP